MHPRPVSFHLSRLALPSLTRGDARQRKGGGMNKPFPSLIDRCGIAAGSPLLQAAVAPVGFERVTNKLLPCEG